jgi:hypothetical protein
VTSDKYRIAPALLLAVLALVLYEASGERGYVVMKTFAFAAERPPIDLATPAKLETATFALG